VDKDPHWTLLIPGKQAELKRCTLGAVDEVALFRGSCHPKNVEGLIFIHPVMGALYLLFQRLYSSFSDSPFAPLIRISL
jgi:hypothetical protein